MTRSSTSGRARSTDPRYGVEPFVLPANDVVPRAVAGMLAPSGQLPPPPPAPERPAPGAGAEPAPAGEPLVVEPAPPVTAGPTPREPGQEHRGRRLLVPALTVLLSLAAGFLGGRLTADRSTSTDTTPSTTLPAQPAPTTAGPVLDGAAVVAAMRGSVVAIETAEPAQAGPLAPASTGAGSGVVIDSDGHILTNAHLVEGASAVTVTLPGDRQARAATVVDTDPPSDLAVLHVDESDDLRPPAMAEPGSVRVGDPVVAIGNALGLAGDLSVTQGIVSGRDRRIGIGTRTLRGLIQTDAAISSGTSGGPLVAADGDVVGIVTVAASGEGGAEVTDIGFAIPIWRALDVAESLLGP